MRQRHPFSLLTSICFALFSFAAVTAHAGPLSGRVANQGGDGIASATVEVLNPGSGGTVASGITDGSGNYNIIVADGTYDVRVTPLGGSGFGTASVLGFAVAGPTTLNVVLASDTLAVLEGRLLDGAGTGISMETIRLIPDGGEIGPITITDGIGHFRFDVAPGAYRLVIEGSNHNFAFVAPQIYTLLTSAFTIDGSLIADFRLPVNRVDVHVQNPSGAGEGNVGLSSSNAFNCTLTFGPTTACGVSNYSFDPSIPPPPGSVTDAGGNATLWLFSSPPLSTDPEVVTPRYSITAIPPAGSPFGPTTVGGLHITGPALVTITLSTPITLSGRLTDGAGAGVVGQLIQLELSGTSAVFSAITGAMGSYSFQLQPSDYFLVINGGNQNGAISAPQIFSLVSSVFTLSANQTIDLRLPALEVDVLVKKPDGSNSPDTGIATSNALNCTLSLSTSPPPAPAITACGSSNYFFSPGGTAPGFAVTGADGRTTLWLFPTPPQPGATYSMTATPPADSGAAATSFAGLLIPPTSLTLTLSAPITLSGTLLDGTAAPIPSQTLQLISDSGNPVETMTSDTGAYAFAVPGGTYNLGVLGDNQAFTVNTPQFYSLNGAPFSLTTNQPNVDLLLPVKRLTVRVQDSSVPPQPIPGVGFTTSQTVNCALLFGPATACGSSFYFYFPPPPGQAPPAFGVTDGTGSLDLWLFPTPAAPPPGEEGAPTTYTVTAIPTSNSGFESLEVQGVTLTDDATLVIVLPTAHAGPVTTLAISPPAGSDGNYTDPVTITLSATATPPFVITQTLYAVDGGELQLYGGPFMISGNGDHSVRYLSVDSGGISEQLQLFSFHIGAPIDSLIGTLRNLCAAGLITKRGICNSLEAKLLAALSSIAQNNFAMARSQLNAFLNELNAQRGKAVTLQAYLELRTAALAVLESLP